jgi:hypothetical protein
MSLKIDLMVADIQENNKQYILMTKSMVRSYLMHKYRCSAYMANQAVKVLFPDPNTDES